MDDPLLHALRLHYVSLLPAARAEATILAHATLMGVANYSTDKTAGVEFRLEGSDWLRTKAYEIRDHFALLMDRFSDRDRERVMSLAALSIRYPRPNVVVITRRRDGSLLPDPTRLTL